MKKGTKRKKVRRRRQVAAAGGNREPDFNQIAQHLVRMSTEGPRAVVAVPAPPAPPSELEIKRVMAELGRRGGKIGGKNRAKNLTSKKRIEIASKAAQARWANRKKP